MIKEKVRKQYNVKRLPLAVKDFDTGSRMVSGYLSSFNVKDSDEDIIKPGAFAKSIAEKGVDSETNRKIAFLRNHNWDLPIGKFTELEEDAFGLRFVAKLSESTYGKDAFIDYQEGIIREHSIGFRYIWDSMKYDDQEDGFVIWELNLFEGSAVLFGANEHTPVTEVAKSLTDDNREKVLADLAIEQDRIFNALKNGKGSDNRLLALEMKQRQLNDTYSSLIRASRPPKEALKTEGRPDVSTAYDFLKHI